MTNKPSDKSQGAPPPHPPPPSAPSPRDGLERARAILHRYLPDLVHMNIGIALADHTDASLHTRMMASKEVREAVSGAPPSVPLAPPPRDETDGGGA